jgi:hypothetical protein
MTPTFVDADKRVARGAALLDQKRPGWHRELADKNIEVSQPSNCVLYHLYGSWAYGLAAVVPDHHGSAYYGLACLSSDDDQYRELWTKEITSRLAAESAPIAEELNIPVLMALFPFWS